jgi:t-SNARE complex subunit (syntaxin)
LHLLDTPQDNKELRARLKEEINDATELGKVLKQMLGRASFSAAPGKKDPRIEKMSRQFAKEMKTTAEIAKAYAEKERTLTSTMRRISRESLGQAAAGGHAAAANDHKQQQQKFAAQDFNLQVLSTEVSELEEREEQLKEIEKDVRQLNELFKDAAFLIEAQQESINTLADNITQTKEKTEDAFIQIEEAAKHQKSARSKSCWLLLILVVAAAVLALGLGLGLGLPHT